MYLQVKSIVVLFVLYLTNAYNVNNQLAYWRLKRSFILNNVFPKTAYSLVKHNRNISIYPLHYDCSYDEYFVQHGEVPIVD